MDITSKNAYIIILQCNLASLADKYANYRKIGDCRSTELGIEIEIISAMIKLLRCYQLSDSSEADNINCLTMEEMKSISNFLNKLLDLNFCIDFKLD